MIVLFTADTEGDFERYEWDFGEGSGSTAETAMHLYNRAGTYTVSLTVTGPDGEAIKTKTDLIVVSDFGSGETRLAAGDIDGDGMPEIIVGLGAVNGVADMPGGSFQILDDDFSPLTWGQVNWPEYNNLNGETWPAVGDLDGDGIAEIVIGLVPGGGGLVQVFQYADGAVVSAGWTQGDWFEYSESHGETRVATGDLDADGIDELVIGFGPSDGSGATAGGNFLIKDEYSDACGYYYALNAL